MQQQLIIFNLFPLCLNKIFSEAASKETLINSNWMYINFQIISMTLSEFAILHNKDENVLINNFC